MLPSEIGSRQRARQRPENYDKEATGKERWHGIELATTRDYRDYDILNERIKSHMAAADSLRESEMETLTAIRLALPDLLRLTLLSTNSLESAFSLVKPKIARVKNWRSGSDQVSRWATTAPLEAGKGIHAIQGYKQIPLLLQ